MTQPTDPTALAAARELVNLVIVEWEWDEVSAEFRESLAQAIAAHTDAAVKEKDERLRLGGYNYTILAQQNGDLRVQLAAAEKTIRQLDISPNEAGEMVTLRTKLAERERDDCLAKLAAAEGELAKWPVRYDNMCRTSYAHQELKRVVAERDALTAERDGKGGYKEVIAMLTRSESALQAERDHLQRELDAQTHSRAPRP